MAKEKAIAIADAIDALTRVPETWHGVVMDWNKGALDRCHHKHRTRRAAQLCAEQMMRALEKK